MENHSTPLGPVPMHLVREAAAKKTGLGWIVEFNIATWLNLAVRGPTPIALRVSYLDGDKPREVLVDKGTLHGAQRILLCGIARLGVNQKLESMSLSLETQAPIQSLLVEELFVQAVEKQVVKQGGVRKSR
ncbi:hypothetical protein HNP46_004598 [Pseudomonas nitritireducens]|uniref:Uncharacterized protein n=1 Tax=Pseudomonas nitroreducens TaxID=46680 RepID=A0A7W7KMS2_PSENT|nr:hypothetical protein [Pseudomonas nitritireducens]MBB4865697.1 hypothetical protein [Pseudomonas nitritireducens]